MDSHNLFSAVSRYGECTEYMLMMYCWTYSCDWLGSVITTGGGGGRMDDVVSTAPCPGRVQLVAGPLGRPRRDPLPLATAAAPDNNALAAAMVGGANPEATPTDPRSDAVVGGAATTEGGATVGRLLLVVVTVEEEVGVAVGGGVCFFERMRSSITSLRFLGRGTCGVGEELFSSAG